jgi:hypothetical protein
MTPDSQLAARSKAKQEAQAIMDRWLGSVGMADRFCMRPRLLLKEIEKSLAERDALIEELLAACKALQMEAAVRGCGLRIADEAIAKAEAHHAD